MKVLGVIPARGGSKGVPRKNIKICGGKPLIAWSIEAAKASSLTRVVLSTEDDEIAGIAKQYGCEVPFKRPQELATDLANAIDNIQHAVLECEKEDGKYDAIMMLQPTAPMRLAQDINDALNMLENDPEIDSVITLTEAGEYPERMKYLDDEGFIVDPPFCEKYENQPRQELRPIYEKNGSIYLTRRDVFIESHTFKGKKSKALLIPQERSINIDSPFQFKLADLLLSLKD